MVKRIVTGAHYGMRDWLGQRVTAVVMAVYTLMLLLAVLMLRPSGYQAWKLLFSNGWIRFASFLFCMSLLYHAWVGLRDILMDYIKPTGIRLMLEVVVILALVGYGGWAAQILWRI